ncbi:uncharacterized protein LOC133183282 [Saccostrea echinata]|uniref:uncharacterized protein LOC133183282 n=1 Tax=Saccostrea echinata TaxID=191078 RepID=UPI002A836B1E|nr:uncharacterized protein LOC133183282 [Saccostrea echinata]
MSFALFGHSFIARVANHPTLDTSNFPVHCFGLNGGTSRQVLFHNITQKMIRLKPKKIFIQIGENDISFNSDPFQIVKDIIRLVNAFRVIPDLDQVILGRLFKRYRLRGMSVEGYEIQRTIINLCLQKSFQNDDVITFRSLNGLEECNREDLCDGVHLHKQLQSRYAEEIKNILLE